MIILMTLMITNIIKRLKFLNLINIMVSERSWSFNSFSLLYGFGIIIPLLKKENKLFIPPIWYINKILDKSNFTLKNFLKKIKMRKDYSPTLISLGIGSALFLV